MEQREDRPAEMRTVKIEKGGVRYRVTGRAPRSWEAEGEVCYDLEIASGSGTVVLRDVARSEGSAVEALRFFAHHGVRPEEAEYVMEDLLADLPLPF